jgi:hypothetical protein
MLRLSLPNLPPDRALARARRIGGALALLLWVPIALVVLIEIPEIVITLFGLGRVEAWRAYVSATDMGLALSIGGASVDPFGVPLDALDHRQRALLAALAGACAGSRLLLLLNLRWLFALYARGTFFAAENSKRIRHAAIWLVVAALAANVCDHVFMRVTGVLPRSIANVAMAVFFGVTLYLIAYVMELAREADLERKEFV